MKPVWQNPTHRYELYVHLQYGSSIHGSAHYCLPVFVLRRTDKPFKKRCWYVQDNDEHSKNAAGEEIFPEEALPEIYVPDNFFPTVDWLFHNRDIFGESFFLIDTVDATSIKSAWKLLANDRPALKGEFEKLSQLRQNLVFEITVCSYYQNAVMAEIQAKGYIPQAAHALV